MSDVSKVTILLVLLLIVCVLFFIYTTHESFTPKSWGYDGRELMPWDNELTTPMFGPDPMKNELLTWQYKPDKSLVDYKFYEYEHVPNSFNYMPERMEPIVDANVGKYEQTDAMVPEVWNSTRVHDVYSTDKAYDIPRTRLPQRLL